MKKFKSFQEFNESFMEDIFRSAHAAVEKENLEPLKKYIGKPKFPTQDQVDKAVEFLGIDPDYLFYDKSNVLNPFIYWKGPVFYGFFGGLNMEALKMMQADKYFEQKLKFVENALKTKSFQKLFDRVDKKILIPTFIEMYNDIPDDQKYDVFVDLYMRSEFGFEMLPKEILNDLFKKRNFSGEWKKRMQSLKKKLKSSPKVIKVYRGVGSKSTKDGISWTLSKKVANFFANRFGNSGEVQQKEIHSSEIIDYLTDRGEEEIFLMK
jgi:hypothetical protein